MILFLYNNQGLQNKHIMIDNQKVPKQNNFSILTHYFSQNSIQDMQAHKYPQVNNDLQNSKEYNDTSGHIATRNIHFTLNILQRLYLRNLIIAFNHLKCYTIKKCSSKNIIYVGSKRQIQYDVKDSSKTNVNAYSIQNQYVDSINLNSFNIYKTPKSTVSKTTYIQYLQPSSSRNRLTNKQGSLVHKIDRSLEHDKYYQAICLRSRSQQRRKSILKQISDKLMNNNERNIQKQCRKQTNKVQISNKSGENDNYLTCRIRRLQKLVKNIRRQKNTQKCKYNNSKSIGQKQNRLTNHQQFSSNIKQTHKKPSKNMKQLLTQQIHKTKTDLNTVISQNKLIKSLSKSKYCVSSKNTNKYIKQHFNQQFTNIKHVTFFPGFIQHKCQSTQSTYQPKQLNRQNDQFHVKKPSIKCQQQISSGETQEIIDKIQSQKPAGKSIKLPNNQIQSYLTLKSFSLTDPYHSQISYDQHNQRAHNRDIQQISYNYSRAYNSAQKQHKQGSFNEIMIGSETLLGIETSPCEN